jgi:pSer/pThr/pTyr-binding forkhead associated (FHA) protein
MSARVMGWVHGTGRLDASLGTLARVGATPDNDIVVRVDGVSRLHARIVGEQDGYWVEDANSRNGTWLNGERVKRARLRHLDVITLGRYVEFVFVEREGAEPPAPPTLHGLRVRLEWLDGPRRGDVVDITAGETLMGRADSCAVVVDTPAVSRAHARISNGAGRVVIEDLGSANGTKVNGELVKGPVSLSSGDEVVLGDARRFRVVIDGAIAAASVPTQLGATPAPSQDMDWATKLVFSAEDLEAISRAAATLDQPNAPPMRPLAKAPRTPAAPMPPSSIGDAGRTSPGALAPPAERTRLGGADLRVPTGIGQSTPASSGDAAATQSGAAPPGMPPAFAPPKFSPPNTGSTVGPVPERTILDGPAVGGSSLPPSVRPPERSANARIRAVALAGQTGTFTLGPGTSTVGRSADATLRIDSRELSRIHAAITVGDRSISIEDRGSVNGTSVNGARIGGASPLVAGDRIAFANVEFDVDVTWSEGN